MKEQQRSFRDWKRTSGPCLCRQRTRGLSTVGLFQSQAMASFNMLNSAEDDIHLGQAAVDGCTPRGPLAQL